VLSGLVHDAFRDQPCPNLLPLPSWEQARDCVQQHLQAAVMVMMVSKLNPNALA
jgi:hypothetical protein